MVAREEDQPSFRSWLHQAAAAEDQAAEDDEDIMMFDELGSHHHGGPRPGSAAPLLPPSGEQDSSPKHNGCQVRKSTLHQAKVSKDESLYSIDSDASTVGSERKNKMLNGPKHANLKR